MAKAQRITHEQELVDNTAIDYSAGMFEDGHNRTKTNKKAHDAPDYDRAAHKTEPAFSVSIDNDADVSAPVDTFHSRDGTDAVGQADEDGGTLGGSEAELDALEAGATPVDRNPRMKN